MLRALLAVALLVPGLAPAQEMPLAPRSDFGRVVVSERQLSGDGDIVLEQVFGAEFDSEPAYTYPEISGYRQLGRAVGRLDVLTDQGVGYCTAFIVSDKYLLTNHHCVPGPEGLTIQSVQFVAGYVETGVREGTKVYSVNAVPVESDEALDYAVLEVFGNPAAEWGTLPILPMEIAADTHGGLPLLVIGHPIRLALHISRKECRAALRNPVSAGKLRHTCDTLQGNSGSPVLSEDLRVVIALHHAGSRKDGVNFAIPMSAILERSELLAGLVDAAAPAPDPAPDPGPDEAPGTPPDTARLSCSGAGAHYGAASGIGTRAALEAHLGFYGHCEYAPFAEALLAAMEAPDPAPDPVPDPEPDPEPPVAATVEDRARAWLEAFFDAMEVSPEAMAPFYYDRVVADGRVWSRAQIVDRQRESFARSPRRELTFHPETFSAECTSGYCRLFYENTVVTYPDGSATAERYDVQSSVLIEGDAFAITEVIARRCSSLEAC